LIWESERLGIELNIAPGTPQLFADVVGTWASKRLSSRLSDLWGSEEEQRELKALIGVKVLLPRIELSGSLSEHVWEKVDDLDAHRERAVRAYSLYPVLTRLF